MRRGPEELTLHRDGAASLPGLQLGVVALLALVPWLVFVAVLAGHGYSGLAGAAAITLLFIALPSAAPIALAPPGVAVAGVLVVLSAVSAYAANFLNTSESSTAGLVVFVVAEVALPLALVIWVTRVVVGRRRSGLGRASATAVLAEASHRAVAIVIDTLVLVAVLVVPLTMLSHRGQEALAVVIGFVVATGYLAAFVVATGATPGQSLLRLRVVDVETRERLTVPQALLRSAVIVFEVAGTLSFVLAPVALGELFAASSSGRSVTDRLVRSAVLSSR